MPAKTAIDIDGSEAVSTALLALLNQFPGLKPSEKILFSTVPDDGGIGFYPTSGAVYLQNKEDITGRVRQVCQYPFSVIYRAGAKTENQRLRIKEFLDALGKWLERQPVTIGGSVRQLREYPALASGNREIQSISRTNPAHLNAAYDDGMEDWVISATLNYKNEFYKTSLSN